MRRVKVDITNLQAKLARLKNVELPRAQKEKLQGLARECLAQIQEGTPEDRRARIAAALERQLKAIFVPVILKHQRREMWPDLQLIYRRRILDHQRTFQGRKRFYVDTTKEEALYQELLRRATAKLGDPQYIFRLITTSDRRWRLEIIRRDAQPSRNTAVMIAYAKQRFRAVTEDAIQTALTRSGLR